MAKEIGKRIAAEDLDNCHSWYAPTIDGNGNILPTVQKQQREDEARKKESIEDVDIDEQSVKPLTAEQLQTMADEAQKEGYEEGKRQGINEGLSQGQADGRAQAYAEHSDTLKDQLQRFSRIVDALEHPLQTQEHQLERLLVSTIVQLTRSLVQRELQTDSGDIVGVVQQALAALPVGVGQITLSLNPDDLAIVENYAEEHQKEWRFQSDASLLPGGCRVQTRESLVDYSVETRMEQLLQDFASQQLVDESVTEAEQLNRLERDIPLSTYESATANHTEETNNPGDTDSDNTFAEPGGQEPTSSSDHDIINPSAVTGAAASAHQESAADTTDELGIDSEALSEHPALNDFDMPDIDAPDTDIVDHDVPTNPDSTNSVSNIDSAAATDNNNSSGSESDSPDQSDKEPN